MGCQSQLCKLPKNSILGHIHTTQSNCHTISSRVFKKSLVCFTVLTFNLHFFWQALFHTFMPFPTFWGWLLWNVCCEQWVCVCFFVAYKSVACSCYCAPLKQVNFFPNHDLCKYYGKKVSSFPAAFFQDQCFVTNDCFQGSGYLLPFFPFFSQGDHVPWTSLLCRHEPLCDLTLTKVK